MGQRLKSYIVWIAWRNLIAHQKRNGLSFMTMVSICGVAIGVAALIVVLSVMGGFEADLVGRMLRGQPHLEILNQSPTLGFSLYDLDLKQVQKVFPESTRLEPFTQADVVLKQRRHMTSAVIFGVEPGLNGHVWGFGNSVIEGDLSQLEQPQSPRYAEDSRSSRRKLPGIALGADLALLLGADLGDEITALSPQASAHTAISGGTVSRQYIVVAKFQTGLMNYDAKWAVVGLDEGRKFMPDYAPELDEEAYVTGIALNVVDPISIDKTLDLAKKRAGALGSDAFNFNAFDFLSWQEANKSLLFALKLEKFTMGSILMLIVLVAAFSISGTMMMNVFHRRGQVSLLRALGMSQREVGRLYLVHGFTIGTVGIILGFAMGVGICALIKGFQFVPLPQGMYQLKFLPCKWLWFDYVVICVGAWLFSLVAALYPAFVAAKQEPSAGLRFL